MTPSSLSSARMHPSTCSSGDEYNSVSHPPIGQEVKDAFATPIHPNLQEKSNKIHPFAVPMTLNAGMTPGPLTKQNNNQFNSHRRFPSVHLSKISKAVPVSRVVVSSHKKKCLFDTMHVKPALALQTVFYLLGLALLDQLFFTLELSEFVYLLFGVSSICFVAAILVAQYGLLRENLYLILPFLLAQGIFTVVVCVAYFRQIAIQLLFVRMHPQVAMRVILLMLHETVLTLMQTYALMVTWRCINYLRSKSKIQVQDRPSVVSTRKLVYDMPNHSNKKINRFVDMRIEI